MKPQPTDLLLTRGDGTLYLEAYAWPGGYPIVYVCADGEIVCPDCAVQSVVYQEWDGSQEVVAWDILYEGPRDYCAHCNAAIDSAYGDPDAADEADKDAG